MVSHLMSSEAFHVRWIKRQIERLEEMRTSGEKETTIQIGELQRLLLENLALHERLDRMEQMVFGQLTALRKLSNMEIPSAKL